MFNSSKFNQKKFNSKGIEVPTIRSRRKKYKVNKHNDELAVTTHLIRSSI